MASQSQTQGAGPDHDPVANLTRTATASATALRRSRSPCASSAQAATPDRIHNSAARGGGRRRGLCADRSRTRGRRSPAERRAGQRGTRSPQHQQRCERDPGARGHGQDLQSALILDEAGMAPTRSSARLYRIERLRSQVGALPTRDLQRVEDLDARAITLATQREEITQRWRIYRSRVGALDASKTQTRRARPSAGCLASLRARAQHRAHAACSTRTRAGRPERGGCRAFRIGLRLPPVVAHVSVADSRVVSLVRSESLLYA